MALTICNCRGCDACGDYCPEFVQRGKCDECRSVQEKTRRREPVSNRWRNFSRHYLRLHPTCVGFPDPCGQPATQVDHIDGSGRNGPNAFADWNLQPLCQSCHSRKTSTQDGGFGRWG